MTLSSRFHPINALLVPSILVFMLMAIGCFTGFICFWEVENGHATNIFKTPIYLSGLLLLAAIGTAIHHLKILKKVKISDEGILFRSLFKTELISWESVERIELLGKNFKPLSPVDSTILHLKNGRVVDFWAPFYGNMPVLRQTLTQVATSLENKTSINIQPIAQSFKASVIPDLDLNRMTKHSGNHVTSFNGVLIYGSLLFYICVFLTAPSDSYLLITGIGILPTTLLYGFLGYQLYYFYLDHDYLVVKNHVFPWIRDVYPVRNIKIVDIEIPYKRSTSMRVITKEYRTGLYPADSLRKKHWKELSKHLQSLGIEVRDDRMI